MTRDDYGWVAAAIRWLEEHRDEKPSLEELGRVLGASPFHLQRVFKRWAGISPKRFLQLLALEDAKRALASGSSVLQAALGAGLSGTSRLHDHFVSIEAMSPGEWSAGGSALELGWGRFASPFGSVLAAWSERGICALRFLDEGKEAEELQDLRARFPAARWREDAVHATRLGRRIFDRSSESPLRLHVRGTNFQVQVWRALLALPAANCASYADVARSIAAPLAARAVGTAVGTNPVAFLIPCHRVLRSSGALGGYRWGLERKRAMLAWEAAESASKERDAAGIGR